MSLKIHVFIFIFSLEISFIQLATAMFIPIMWNLSKSRYVYEIEMIFIVPPENFLTFIQRICHIQ